MTSILTHVAVALVYAAAIPATLFPLLYGLRSAWWRTEIGRGLMVQAIGLMLLVDLSVVYRVWHPPGLPYVRVAVYGLVLLGLSWLLVVLVRVQHRSRTPGGRRHDDERSDR